MLTLCTAVHVPRCAVLNGVALGCRLRSVSAETVRWLADGTPPGASLPDRDSRWPASVTPMNLTAPHFVGGPIDDLPQLLEQSYRLRYEVYCLERKFLPAEDYPTGLEIDEFDGHALHVGAMNAAGELAGTSRAVTVTAKGLPLFDHCAPFPHETEFHRANPRLVEVGRLIVSRSYRRRRTDVTQTDSSNISRRLVCECRR